MEEYNKWILLVWESYDLIVRSAYICFQVAFTI